MKFKKEICIKMFSPYSISSVWRDEKCANHVKFIIIISVIVLCSLFINGLGILMFKIHDSNYDYTTGCGQNKTSNDDIGDHTCFINGVAADERRVICLKPIYLIDFAVCSIVGLIPILFLLIIVFILIETYHFCVKVKDIVEVSYNKSVKEDGYVNI